MTRARSEISIQREWIRRLRGLLRVKRRPASLDAFLTTPTLRWAEEWGWEENIQGVYLGWRRHQLCLNFIVEKKINESRLTRRKVIPELLRHPRLGMEIATNVVELGSRLELQAPYAGTLRAGLPIGHGHGFPSGTLGFIVQRTVGNRLVRSILSCAHVLAWTRKGIFPLPHPRDFTEQPVSLDADPEDFRVARLSSAFTDLTKPQVGLDFALADIPPEIRSIHQGSREVSDRSLPEDFPRGLQLRMNGQVSGMVGGRVRGVEAAVRLPAFGNVSFGHWEYQSVMVYDVRNAKGDSGAGIVEAATGRAAGLHVGGDGRSLGLFYPVRPIFDRFGLQLPA